MFGLAVENGALAANPVRDSSAPSTAAPRPFRGPASTPHSTSTATTGSR
jgi:hypothetical protein